MRTCGSPPACLLVAVAAVLLATSAAAEPDATPGGQEAPAAHAHHGHATVRHSFEDVARWSALFDDPSRDEWQKPAEVARLLGLRPGMTVADIGAGTGYFSRHLASAVGDAGTVFAVEPEPNLVRHLRDRAEKEGTANVVPVLASFDNPRLPAGAADVIVIVDTFHHIDDRLSYFHRLKRALKPAGHVAIIDFKKEPLPVGPPVEHKLSSDEVVEEMRRAGYRLLSAPAVLPYQYFLVFAPE